jgi:gluconolactonase
VSHPATIRFDDGLSAIAGGRAWETVAEGFGFTEGPVWHRGGSLLFSDIPNSRIYRWRDGVLPDGAGVSVYREPSGRSNGLTFDEQGRLVSCHHELRCVMRETAHEPLPIATHFEGKRLNSPNDVVVRSDGRIFFTDPPYGIREERIAMGREPVEPELPYNGVYTIAPQGSLALLVDDFDRPNGLALSPDERTLYIADTNRRHVRAFDVDREAALTNGRVFAEMREEGRPDGMKVDRDGRLYVSAGTVQVFAADGRPLGVIDCPQSPANCAWGDAAPGGAGSDFYITARTAVYRMRIDAVGIAPHLR